MHTATSHGWQAARQRLHVPRNTRTFRSTALGFPGFASSSEHPCGGEPEIAAHSVPLYPSIAPGMLKPDRTGDGHVDRHERRVGSCVDVRWALCGRRAGGIEALSGAYPWRLGGRQAERRWRRSGRVSRSFTRCGVLLSLACSHRRSWYLCASDRTNELEVPLAESSESVPMKDRVDWYLLTSIPTTLCNAFAYNERWKRSHGNVG